MQLNKIYVCFVFSLLVAGCATPAHKQAMVVAPHDTLQKYNNEFKGNLNLGVVSGGRDTNPLWTSQVDSQTFRSALDESLSAMGYKSHNSSTAKYNLDAVIQDISQPVVGFSFDVTSTVIYTISGGGRQDRFPVVATGTATVSDAFLGVERLRLANEKSMKENIKQFFQAISER